MWKGLTRVGVAERRLELLLRIGAAGCFIGHGAFGVIGKEAWLPYFAVAGIPEAWAWRLMPLVGGVDILVGVLVLLAPRGILLVYMAGWAFWTALLRPLAGESFFETLERAGNYGIPIAFLLLLNTSWRPTLAWLRTVEVPVMSPERRHRISWVLRGTTATLLAGHGGLALLGKPLLLSHAEAVGLPAGSLALVGAFELILAAWVAVRPAAPLLLFILAWKLGTEALYPFTGAPFWEFVERAGSYIAPLALYGLMTIPARSGATGGRSARPVLTATLLAAVLLGASLGMEPTGERIRQEATLLAQLRSGGFTLACRHAITDRSRGDARRVDFSDRSTQRVLSPAGEAQASALGDILRDQRIPIGEVYTSPYFRTADSAELTFGDAETHDALRGGGDREARRRLLSEVPTAGTNRALMTHQGVLYGLFPELTRGSIREGDCLVVRPTGDAFTFAERLGPAEWEALR